MNSSIKHSDVLLVDKGRRCILAAANALTDLAQSLDNSFEHAVDILHRCRGKVVVSGMGKSGHIARKAAATFSSIGIPAFFIHPGEASHGDLGMLTRTDSLLAISNSGNTSELSDILTHVKTLKIPTIGLTSNASSVLAQAATVRLCLPPVREACINGLAPTTSTTLAMAMCDALAVAIEYKLGFSVNDFNKLHPGGKLGYATRPASTLMHHGNKIPTCGPQTYMKEAILVMTQHAFGCIGVVDQYDQLLGIITDGDLRRHMSPSLLTKRAAEVMTSPPITISPETTIAAALHVMTDKRISALFVTQASVPVGILHLHDVTREAQHR